MRPTDYQRMEPPTRFKAWRFYEHPPQWQYTTRATYYRTPIGQRRKSYDNGKSWIENQ